jgi:DNA-binding HxlR family transcriptional regulator
VEEGTSKEPSHSCCTEDAFQWDTREDCDVRQILDRIGDKWSLLVIALLDNRCMRFTELKKTIDGISQRMLTVTLRSLERDGILTRTVYNVMPPNVSYRLTPMGTALLEAATPLLAWTTDALPLIDAARAEYDARSRTAP